MAVRAEPMRRRLTVGYGGGAAGGAGAASGGAGLKEALSAVKERATLRGSEAFAITSITDSDLHRTRAFADKCEVVGHLTADGEVDCCSEEEAKKIAQAVRQKYRVAWKCHKGQKPESPNQDSFSILICRDFALYCVYDGHGPQGHKVSDHAHRHLVKAFIDRLSPGESSGSNVKQAFEEAFEEAQQGFEEFGEAFRKDGGEGPGAFDTSMSGTTVTMVYHDTIVNKLWIAHVGDSRAVLCKRTEAGQNVSEDLTEDHKPNLESERKRIESKGGRVVFDGFYNHRVFAAKGMYPGLNMSRALGDCVGHAEAGLSAQPDVKEVDLSKVDRDVILLMCTDGVWEFIESKAGSEMIWATQKAGEAPNLSKNLETITSQSWTKWMEDSDNEISDDITGIAVLLKTGSTSPDARPT